MHIVYNQIIPGLTQVKLSDIFKSITPSCYHQIKITL